MKIPTGVTSATGNKAQYIALILSRIQSFSAYPITPATSIGEGLAKYHAEDTENEEKRFLFKNMDSEHSMLAHAGVMSHCGLRGAAATSSQGLLYALEQVYMIGRTRIPVILSIVCRSVGNPWHLHADLCDSIACRDAGWLMLYCANQQEVLDATILGIKVAENVGQPVAICQEGFILSHSASRIVVPTQEEVDKYLPTYNPPKERVVDFDDQRTYFQISTGQNYETHMYEIEQAMQKAERMIVEEAERFTKHFGRKKTGLIETYGNPDAKNALVTMGSMGDTAKNVADEQDLLVVRIHAFRPFPYAALAQTLERAENISVIDRACSFGALPPLAAETISAVRKNNVYSFIMGMGGTNVTEKKLKKAISLSVGQAPNKAIWIREEGE